jgi:hypothetical protein
MVTAEKEKWVISTLISNFDRKGGNSAPSHIIYLLKYPRQLVDLLSELIILITES